MGIFWAFKSESILPIQILEIDEETPLFDLHTVGFWGMKNAGKMADSHAPGPILLSDPATSHLWGQNLTRQKA